MSKPVATIITASSNTGSAAVEELLTRYNGSVTVKAAFRSDDKAAALAAKHGSNPNLVIVSGVDAGRPETLGAAFEGASIAYIVTPLDHTRGFGEDQDLNTNMVHAAVAAGVSHIVFGGSWTIHSPDAVPDIAGRFVGTEELLKKLSAEGKVKYTFLRGGWYASNTVQLFGGSLKASSTIFLPPGISVPPIDTDDIGRSAAAVIAVGGAGHEDKAYEMSGPACLDGDAFAIVFTRLLGRPITYRPVIIDDYVAGKPKFAVDLMRHLDTHGNTAVPLSADVHTLTGRHTGFEEWATLNKAAFT